MKRLQEQAAYIATLEPDFKKLSDAELQGKTAEFRQRLENGEQLEDLLFEAFAAVREARLRESDQRIFDVQMMGGIVLHEGDIAEMKTGEGKTFVASLALYLNALAGRGVHLVTANDYLAQRDAEWNRGVFDRLGMTVAYIETSMPFDERREPPTTPTSPTARTPSSASTTCATTCRSRSTASCSAATPTRSWTRSTRSSIDEARTPLIISGEPTTAAKIYHDFARIVPALERRPVERHEARGRAARPGVRLPLRREAQDRRRRPNPGSRRSSAPCGSTTSTARSNVQLVNHLIQALKAEALYKRDVDYVVQDGEVKIVDEFTGRIMEGRRWSEGLHQAVEAKEGVAIQEEHQTLATITLQNYFRLYEKLGGMTGTAKTEEKEFVEIYGLNVVEIPTNVDVARDDKNDLIFKTVEAKFAAVAERREGARTRRASRCSSARSPSRRPSI